MAVDIFILAVVLAYSGFVIRRHIKHRKHRGTGCSGCSGCCGSCNGCGPSIEKGDGHNE